MPKPKKLILPPGYRGPDPTRDLREAVLLEAALAWKTSCFCDDYPEAGKGWTCKGCEKHTHALFKPRDYPKQGVCAKCWKIALEGRE